MQYADIGLAAIGLGANLLGGLIKTRSERKRRAKVRAERLAALKPLEATLGTGQYGLSQSEGNIARTVTQQTLGDLAGRGILDSTISAPAVAQAVAPIQLEHENRNRQLATYIASSKQAIAEDTSAPGYGETLGNAVGDVGGYLALLQGDRDERVRRKQEHNYMMEMLRGGPNFQQGVPDFRGDFQVPAVPPLGQVGQAGEEDYFSARYPKKRR
jgi:hypothetical protein